MRLAMQGHVDEYQRHGEAPDLRDPLLGEWLGSREMDGRQMIEADVLLSRRQTRCW